MHRTRLAFTLLAVLLAGACATVQPAPPAQPPAPVPPAAPPPAPVETIPPAPWSRAPLPAAGVPPVYAAEWRKAGNCATCAPLAPASVDPHAAARPRAATFSGGWAVA
ncbi:MAG TPA: hypothetical protein VK399_09680, partial [Longimicrobiaceae bacterium]|nr:hypothetical protein [Longimicrobiaceae bacterium]